MLIIPIILIILIILFVLIIVVINSFLSTSKLARSVTCSRLGLAATPKSHVRPLLHSDFTLLFALYDYQPLDYHPPPYRTRCLRRHLLPPVRYVLTTILPIILFEQRNMKQRPCIEFPICAQVTVPLLSYL
jgi:hypothetical protein